MPPNATDVNGFYWTSRNKKTPKTSLFPGLFVFYRTYLEACLVGPPGFELLKNQLNFQDLINGGLKYAPRYAPKFFYWKTISCNYDTNSIRGFTLSIYKNLQSVYALFLSVRSQARGVTLLKRKNALVWLFSGSEVAGNIKSHPRFFQGSPYCPVCAREVVTCQTVLSRERFTYCPVCAREVLQR